MSADRSKLGAKWQLTAAMLTNPTDLSALVSLSKSRPNEFCEDDTLHVMVSKLLGTSNGAYSNMNTKLDVLAILSNVAAISGKDGKLAKKHVRSCISGINEWFELYLDGEKWDKKNKKEPELHKAMLLLLARAWEYRLKTEDILELTHNNRCLALETVVGVLEDGKTYSTEVIQRQKPSSGLPAQWEHKIVSHQFEKPLLLQLCILTKGFTHPSTYFKANSNKPSGPGFESHAEHEIDAFSDEIDSLMDVAIRDSVFDKLSSAFHERYFSNETVKSLGDNCSTLTDADHKAIACIHGFIQNIFYYTSRDTSEFCNYILNSTPLVQQLMLPYLRESLSAASSHGTIDDSENNSICSTLHTLIICTFQVTAPKYLHTDQLDLIQNLRVTRQCLEQNMYVFSMICLLCANIGALDESASKNKTIRGDEDALEKSSEICTKLRAVIESIGQALRDEAFKYIQHSGRLPIARSSASYIKLVSMFEDAADKHNYHIYKILTDESKLPETEKKCDRSAGYKSSSFFEEKDCKEMKHRLLGELPSLTCKKNDNFELTLSYTNESKSVRKPQPRQYPMQNFPEKFLCAINSHIMRDPVVSPQGFIFERKTIFQWIEIHGCVCPKTGATLKREDLKADNELRMQILQWLVENNSTSELNGDALYDF